MDYKAGIAVGTAGAAGLLSAALGGLTLRFLSGRKRADRVWEDSRLSRLDDMGSVERLSVLPLIDWYTAGGELVGEAGVSYLVRAGGTTILMDTGFNANWEHPSPLLRNMDTLGVDMGGIDMIFISHPHVDHMGGMAMPRKHTFAISGERQDLHGIPTYAPVPLYHPTSRVEVVEQPRVLAPGVASTGTIPRQLFFLGWTPEQALAVNVEGKGIVLVIGCGHPTIQRLLERADELFEEPVYGIIGGLHYPVERSRMVRAGLPIQRLVGTGKYPWDPVDREDVFEAIALIKKRGPRLVALSAHDSCDWSIGAFRDAFGDSYRELLVGREIEV